MEHKKNPSHPAKGSRIPVEPIRRLKDIKAIQKLLSDNPRNYLLFTMSVNNGLQIRDCRKIKNYII